MNIKLIISYFSLVGLLATQKTWGEEVVIDTFNPYDRDSHPIADTKTILEGESPQVLYQATRFSERTTIGYTFSKDKLLDCKTNPTFNLVANSSNEMSLLYKLSDINGIEHESKIYQIPNNDSSNSFSLNFFDKHTSPNFLQDQVSALTVTFNPNTADSDANLELSRLEAVPEPCSLLMLVGGGAKYFNKLKKRKRKEELCS